MKLILALILTLTMTGCGLEEIASMPTEPEDTDETVYEAEEHPLATADEIMATKGIETALNAAEESDEIEVTDNEPLVEAVEEETEETVEPGDDGESAGEGDREDEELTEELVEGPDNASPEPVAMHLWGVCTLTFYCNCSQCTGQWAGGPTASGTMPTPNHTVACDLPFGTRLMIEGQEYVVEDRGVSGMWVDIFVGSHEEALQRGMYQAEVWIID